MLDVAVSAMQSSALHWVVMMGAAAAFAFRIFRSTDDILMGDIYGDDLDY